MNEDFELKIVEKVTRKICDIENDCYETLDDVKDGQRSLREVKSEVNVLHEYGVLDDEMQLVFYRNMDKIHDMLSRFEKQLTKDMPYHF